jgi:tetratricopeptide (TPR) repeat protein
MKLPAHPGKADTIHIHRPTGRPPSLQDKKGNGMANNDTLLTGDDLLQFMDQLETDLDEGGSSAAVDLRARLNAQPLRADSLEAIARLHTLWMLAEDATAARKVIEEDGAALAQGLPPKERVTLNAHLWRFKLQIGQYLDEAQAMQEALAALHSLVHEPGLEAESLVEHDIFTRLCHSQHLEVALEAAKFCHALNLAIAKRAAYRAWDEAVLHSRIANSHARHGQNLEALAAADKAIAALKTAPDDQEVTQDDWLSLGDALVDIAPERLPDFQAALTALSKDLPLPLRREVEVRLIRLKARAQYARGDLAGALEAAQDGHYALGRYGKDNFIEYELPWLIEAGRLEEAGECAFFHLYQIECIDNDEALENVLRIIHARLADPKDVSVWWPLCVMRACYYPLTLHDLMHMAPGTPWVEISDTHRAIFASLAPNENFAASELSDARFDSVFTAARALAEARAPGHVWIRRLAAIQDYACGRISQAEKIAALEAVIREGLADDRTANNLMGEYLETLGVEKALKCPLPALSSGLWTFNFITNSEDYLEESIDALPEARREAAMRDLRALKQKYYEAARQRMERFFETGKGHPYDASPCLYSMLLCNLAIIYGQFDRNEEAIELSRRGLAISPSSNQYYCILHTYLKLKDAENIVKSAEELWQFVSTHDDSHDYSTDGPTDYVRLIAEALYDLGRANEIPIWLERLTRWEREEAGMDEDNLPDDALYSRLVIALYMTSVPRNKEISLGVWQRIAPQVERSQNVSLWNWAADLLRTLEHWEEAIAFYERSLAVSEDEKITQFLARCRQKLAEKNAPAKRWWQMWK